MRRWPVALAAALVGALLLPAAALGQRASRPDVDAPSAVLVDAQDGTVLYRRAERRRRSVASATKLMTALVALEELPLRRRLAAAPYRAAPAESRIDLRPGERMSVGDLLRALLLESANDAAVTLARAAAGSVSRFVERMNERARELDLVDTSFANPIGLDEPGNHSSALDLATLTRRLIRNDSVSAIVDLAEARLNTGARPRVIDNRNRLVARVPWIDGVKTGHTLQAGYVLVGSGTRKGVRLVSVVLGADSEAQRDTETLRLLRYGFSRYRRVEALRAGSRVATADVAYRGEDAILTVPRSVRLTVRRGQRVRTVADAPDELEGPLREGERVGSVAILRDRERVRVVPLVTSEAVPEAGWARRTADFLARPGTIAIVLVLAVAAVAARRRRRSV